MTGTAFRTMAVSVVFVLVAAFFVTMTVKSQTNHDELMEQCRACIQINCEEPQKVITVLDEMGYEKYKVIDENTVEIYEKLESVKDINKALVLRDVDINDIHTKRDDLEEYFLKLTGN